MKRLAFVLLLAACASGGGSSGYSGPPVLQPSVPVAPQPQTEPTKAAPVAWPDLRAATSVDTLRASGGDDHAALDSVLRVAASRGGRPVVQLVGELTDSSDGLWVPDGVRLEGPATIRFTNRALAFGAVNLGSHVAVVDLTIVGPWERQDYDPHGQRHPGFNGGGGPGNVRRDVELRRVEARGFAGAGYNSGGYVEDVRIYGSRFLANGDAGVQIAPTVSNYRIVGSRAEGNRNNGFDVNGSHGYLADDTATANGQASVLYPDGSSDIGGFFVYAAGPDAVGNVLERIVATANAGHGVSVVGDAAKVRGTVLRDVTASGNGAAAVHVQGTGGKADNVGTRIENAAGEWLHVQHFGDDPGRAIEGLIVRRSSFGRVTVDSEADDAKIEGRH